MFYGKSEYDGHMLAIYRERKLVVVALLVLQAVFVSVLYAAYPEIPGLDWRYFNAMNLISRSILLVAKQIPVLDPWLCGGIEILSNPQQRVFSPLVLLDLLLVPFWANVVSIVLLQSIGVIAAYELFRNHGSRPETALTMSILYCYSSWFGVHLAGGVISYAFFFLVPLLLLCLEKLGQRSKNLCLVACFSWFVIDSGVYAFFFSIVTFVLCWVVNWKNTRHQLQVLLRDWRWSIGLACVLLLLTFPKVLPILDHTISRAPEIEHRRIDILEFADMVFNPLASVYRSNTSPQSDNLVGGAMYLGFLGVGIVAAGMLRWSFVVAHWKTIAIFTVLLWTSLGWGGSFNPWTLYVSLPFAQHAHIQARLLVLAHLFFLLLIAAGVEQYFSAWRKYTLLGCLCLESLFVYSHAWVDTFLASRHLDESSSLPSLGAINTTVDWARKPAQYYGDAASRNCYEKAVTRPATVKSAGSNGYLGEAFALTPFVQIEQFRRTAEEISIALHSDNGGEIVINTNDLPHWIVTQGAAKRTAGNDGLLHLEVKPGQQQIVLQYRPWYLGLVLFAYGAGLLLLSRMSRSCFHREKSSDD